jgi:VRR-NUC domain.
MKAPNGRLTENQKEIIEKLRKENYKVSIINNISDFINEISNYLKNK